MTDAVIVAAVRSPMGRAGKGQFLRTRIDDIGAAIIKAALARVPQIKGADIEDVLVGCAMPEGEQGLNVARNISLLAGIPFSAGAATVNRFCGSSLETINMAVHAIKSGSGDCFVIAGIESMSHVPMGGFNPSLNPKLMEPESAAYIGMGTTAENLAKKFSISREDQDKFALSSHQKAIAAQEKGLFKDEIIPTPSVQADGSIKLVDKDEGPRADSTLEKLSSLKPAFLAGGTVTAGNSSPLTDGAAAVIVMSADKAKALGIKPIAKILGTAIAGVDPAYMGEGPAIAIPKALKRAGGLTLDKIDLIEVNEAFAAQTLAVAKILNIDLAKLNVHGGAIALGHPLGCSGARIMATLVHALQQTNKTLGIDSLCIGGGQGIATVIERLN